MPRAVYLRGFRIRPGQVFIKTVHDEEVRAESPASEDKIPRVRINKPYRVIHFIGGSHGSHGGDHHDDDRKRIENIPTGKLVLGNHIGGRRAGHQGKKSRTQSHEQAVEIHHMQGHAVRRQRKTFHPVFYRPYFGQAVYVTKKFLSRLERVHQTPEKGKEQG